MRPFVSRAPTPANAERSFSTTTEPPTPVEQRQEVEGSRLDRLDIQASIESSNADIQRIDDRVNALGPCACLVYLHVAIVEGAVKTLAQFNARVRTVAASLIIEFETELVGTYSAIAVNQLDGSDSIFRPESRRVRELDVRATDVIGVPLDLSVGLHEFVLICRGLLPV